MALLEFFAANRNGFLDVVSTIGKMFGEEMVLLGIVCILMWCVDKKLAYRIGFAYFSSAFFSQELKVLIRVPRPWVLNPNLVPMESALSTATGYSFPSAHSQTVGSMYGTIAINVKKRLLQVVCGVAILLTAWSRMYAGVHTPWDVCVGLLIGLVCAAVCHIWVGPMIEEEKDAKVPCIVLGVMSLIGLITTLVLFSMNIIEAANGKDLLACSGACLAFALAYYLDMTKFHITIEGSIVALIIKVVLGMGTTMAIRVAAKVVLSPIGIAETYVRYFMMAIWALLIFPWLFNKVLRRVGR